MKTIVWEQNERRKSELDALQSQINPHFLYNALDSITWMIEGEQNDERRIWSRSLHGFSASAWRAATRLSACTMSCSTRRPT